MKLGPSILIRNSRMAIKIHPHARERMLERGASEEEILRTIIEGDEFKAKFDRKGFRRNFPFNAVRKGKGKHCQTKQVEVYDVEEDDHIIVITVVVKYF